ncbi:unnamed protein product [Caenorhabditis brenneri]
MECELLKRQVSLPKLLSLRREVLAEVWFDEVRIDVPKPLCQPKPWRNKPKFKLDLVTNISRQNGTFNRMLFSAYMLKLRVSSLLSVVYNRIRAVLRHYTLHFAIQSDCKKQGRRKLMMPSSQVARAFLFLYSFNCFRLRGVAPIFECHGSQKH